MVIPYNGSVGTFNYDDTMFEIQKTENNEDYLHYIGSETDGSKITIPLGVKNCTLTFSNTDIVSQPEIPPGVTCTDSMFLNCPSLVQTKRIPYGVEDCNSMYSYCPGIKYAPQMPGSVKSADFMYDGCESLETVPPLSSNLESCKYMFSNCSSLTVVPDIPASVKNADGICLNCVSITYPPSLSEGLESIENGFVGCDNMLEAPKLPSSVKSFDNITEDCYWLNDDFDDTFDDIAEISEPTFEPDTKGFAIRYKTAYSEYSGKMTDTPSIQRQQVIQQSGIDVSSFDKNEPDFDSFDK